MMSGWNLRLSAAAIIILPLLISLTLRLYPTLLSGLPFSIDAWPLIRNTEVLLEHTPVSLDEKIFDGYNNYWPASSIFGAVLSRITGLNPIATMALGLPTAASLTIPIFYVLTYRLYRSRVPALFTSILLAAAFPYVLSMAGVIKETYASPLYMLLILVFLGLEGWRGAVLFVLSSISLVMAHHLSSIVALVALASMALSTSLRGFLRGIGVDLVRLALTLMLAASIALYFIVYAYKGLRMPISLSDLITAASYQAAAFTLALYVTRRRGLNTSVSSVWAPVKYFIVAAIPALFLATCTFKRITPDAPILPKRYMVYGAPFLISAPLAALGLDVMRRAGGEGEVKIEPVFWFASILGLEAYALFGNTPAGLTLVYRVINFVWPSLAILCGYGAYGLHSAGRWMARVAYVAIVLVVALNCYNIYAATIMGERYMGYFWLHRVQEFRAGAWVSDLCGNRTVTGDVKYAYLLKGYFGLSYNEFQGLLYLSGEDVSKPAILITYDLMDRNGYVVYGGYSIDLPSGWMERAFNLSLIYSNDVVNVHAGG